MKLTLTTPDDFHLHLRDGDALAAVLPHSARCFGRAVVMPNLKPPVTTVAAAAAYRERILAALPEGSRFEPLMTLYLTDNTPPEEILKAKESGFVHAVKLYPAGATTHSDAGVTDWRRCQATYTAMAELGMPLLVHGEATDPAVDIFHRESVFVEDMLAPLMEANPNLKVVLEHVTTSHGVRFVRRSGPNIAATITPHHLLINRNDIFKGGIHPHLYCLPVAKTEDDRLALLEAATSGDPKFFLGTDSAPHPRHAKESCCGPAGIYSAHAAIELYAEAFAGAGKLDRLEDFASRFGAAFYGLRRNQGTIILENVAQDVPAGFALGSEQLVPFRAGETIAWRLAEGA